MATVTRQEAAPSPSSPLSNLTNSTNVFVLLYLAIQNYINTCNFDATGRYAQQDLMNKQLQVEMANWKAHADDLPNAGNQGKSEDIHQLNGDGILTGSVLLACAAVLVPVVIALYAMGMATSWGGIGLMFIAIAAAITAVIVGIMTLAGKFKTDDYTTTIPGYITYDSGKQSQAQNQCQQDQQNVQLLQTSMSQILQQYITPTNNAKDAAANIQQAIFQWLKAIVWSS
jgi:hypothetical protein